MIITKMAMPRRTFLRGIGATLALPWLDAMAPALSATAKTAGVTQRLGFFYVANGIQLENFIPKAKGANYEITPILSPLAPFRDHMTVITGLANKEADPLDLGSGPHTRACAVWLNGRRTKRTEGADIEAGTTIDQFAARKLGQDTPLTSLELALEPNFAVGNCEGGYSCVYLNTFSWRTPTMPLPMEINPHVVFERLFGEYGSRAGRLAQIQADRSILDAIVDDMARIRRKLGPSDRTTVSEYLEAIRDVEQRLQKTSARIDTSGALPIEKPLDIPDSFDEHAKLMFDLLFLAYQADITRVATFQICRELSTRSYPDIGVPEVHHEVSHHQHNPERMAKNTKINIYHVELFARFLEKMRTTPDGDGSLLDHSMLLYGPGMGDGDVHYHHDLPVVLVGSGGGQHQGGRHLRYPDLPMMNLGLTLLDKVGVELESIGDSTGRLVDL